MMKAAIVVQPGQSPVFGDFAAPEPTVGKIILRVTAAAISQLVRARASGTHYSSQGGSQFIPGVDGVGVTADGRRVYFALPEHPYGSMGEQTLVDPHHCLPIPDSLSDTDAAALANPGTSSWAGLVERAWLRPGETVLINGATGSSGRLAVQIAKHLGAGKVIATGRSLNSLSELQTLGADAVIPLSEDREQLTKAFQREFQQRVDVVLDYLWGPSAEALIAAASKASAHGVPVRFVQIGGISGPNISLPAAALRSSALQLMGSGLGSVPFPALLKATQGMLTAAPAAGFKIATRVMPLADVTQAWGLTESRERIVLRP